MIVETLHPPDSCSGRMNCKGAETVRHAGLSANAAFILNFELHFYDPDYE
jgi:hypothetical protein